MFIELYSNNDFGFINWYNRASVKSSEVIRVPDDYALGEGRYLPVDCTPHSEHPLVVSKDKMLVGMLQVRQLIDYLDTTILIEQKLVNPIAELFMRDNCPLVLPSQMKVHAYKIVTDEAYHSQVAAELKFNLEDKFSIEPLPLIMPPIIEYLENLRERCSKKDFYFSWVLMTSIFETQVTEDLGRANTKDVFPFVRKLFNDHIQDERRHRMYFTVILELLWNSCSILEKKRLSDLLPDILYFCAEPCGSYTAKRALENLSFSVSEIDIIMNDCYSKEKLVKDMQDFSRPVLKLLHKAGYFEESFVTERLAGEGFPVNPFLSA